MNSEIIKRFVLLLEQTIIKLEELLRDSQKEMSNGNDAFKVSISDKAKRK